MLDRSPLGVTYRAVHSSTGKYVRICFLSPAVAGRERKDEIISCFKTAKSVSHPNLLAVGELGEHNGIAYYTSADFEGRTLRSLIQEYQVAGRKFNLREAAQITIQVLEGLEAAHQRAVDLQEAAKLDRDQLIKKVQQMEKLVYVTDGRITPHHHYTLTRLGVRMLEQLWTAAGNRQAT